MKQKQQKKANNGKKANVKVASEPNSSSSDDSDLSESDSTQQINLVHQESGIQNSNT